MLSHAMFAAFFCLFPSLISVFTAVFVSHLLFDLIYGPKQRVESISI